MGSNFHAISDLEIDVSLAFRKGPKENVNGFTPSITLGVKKKSIHAITIQVKLTRSHRRQPQYFLPLHSITQHNGVIYRGKTDVDPFSALNIIVGKGQGE